MGIPEETDHIAAYCRYAGVPAIPNWSYYMAFMLFRHAAISLGILTRAEQGTAASDHARKMGARAEPQSKAAWDIIQQIN
jgi:aminoglycoside phosphotransferase (APT) family kinase protein